MRLFLVLTVIACAAGSAQARRHFYSQCPVQGQQCPVQTNYSVTLNSSNGLAQSKANQMAQRGVCAHIGGGFGAGTAEGCGFSSVSADDSVRRCCFWGQRVPLEIGVARGANGWFSTVIYK